MRAREELFAEIISYTDRNNESIYDLPERLYVRANSVNQRLYNSAGLYESVSLYERTEYIVSSETHTDVWTLAIYNTSTGKPVLETRLVGNEHFTVTLEQGNYYFIILEELSGGFLDIRRVNGQPPAETISMEVKTTAGGADVYVNGRFMGKTSEESPYSLTFGCDTREIELHITKPGYQQVLFNVLIPSEVNHYELNAILYENKTDSGARQYIVKQGDTLARIARNLLGDSSRWREIMDYNNLTSERLVINQLLLIPPQ
jgi:hypothetical protein